MWTLRTHIKRIMYLLSVVNDVEWARFYCCCATLVKYRHQSVLQSVLKDAAYQTRSGLQCRPFRRNALLWMGGRRPKCLLYSLLFAELNTDGVAYYIRPFLVSPGDSDFRVYIGGQCHQDYWSTRRSITLCNYTHEFCSAAWSHVLQPDAVTRVQQSCQIVHTNTDVKTKSLGRLPHRSWSRLSG